MASSVVPFSHLHFATKHAVDEDEIGNDEHSGERPPNQADAQSVNASGSVVYSEVVLVVASREHNRIKCKRRAQQHCSDIEAGGNKGEFLFALGIRPKHYSEARDDGNRNQYSDLMLVVVIHYFGPDKVSRHQRAKSQKKL